MYVLQRNLHLGDEPSEVGEETSSFKWSTEATTARFDELKSTSSMIDIDKSERTVNLIQLKSSASTGVKSQLGDLTESQCQLASLAIEVCPCSSRVLF